MKKLTTITLAVIAILTMLFSFLPMSTAQAKREGTDVTLKVRNRTGGQVSLKLVDENGNPMFFVYEPGQTSTPLPEGQYTYYASTPCGNRSGIFNVNVTKELLFSCNEGLEIALTVPVGRGTNYCYSVFDYEEPIFAETGINAAVAQVVVDPFPWGKIGTHCQPNTANPGDTILFYNPYYDDSYNYYYELEGVECFQGGNGYYFKPCPKIPN